MGKYEKIGMIAAIDEEKDEIVRHLTDVQVVLRKAGLVFEEGRFGESTVYVVTAGIGKVNAALCSQILIDYLEPDILINVGVAGALDPDLKVGDIVISTEAQQHDFDCSEIDELPGIIPRMETSIFPADRELAQLASAVCEERGYNYRTGMVVSGDQFIGSTARKQRLIDTFHGLCAEMEGAAMAHVCYLNQVPFLILRSISDQADGNAEMSYQEFKYLAAEHAGRLFQGIMQKINQ